MSPKEFWCEVKTRAKKNDADEILVYMQVMLEKANEKCITVSSEELCNHGSEAPLFPGLKDGSWFERINSHAMAHGLDLDHYVISSGIEEMIDGCRIRRQFRHVFASKFIYDKDGEAIWPGVAINYTTKTQYLFRINKGIENHWDNNKINAYTPEDERPIPFRRMIFVGDGTTDIPAMKMMTHNHGYAVAVYDPCRSDSDLKKIHCLISDGRVDFVAPADYQENSQLDITVKGILGRIDRAESERQPV